MTQRILIVDDEPAVCEVIAYNLERHGFGALTAHDGLSALAMARREQPDLIVLDLMLPGMHGHDVCRELRSFSAVPIIILTAQGGDEADRVIGLELGADDFLGKPFGVRELIARIKAVLRRASGAREDRQATLRSGALALDALKRSAHIADARLELTRIEFDLLHLLLANRDRVYTREQLLENVWGYQFFGDARAVDSAIKRLRAKIHAIDPAADGVVAVRGIGYKFSEGERE